MEQKTSTSQLKALRKIRGDWGGVKPYTRIERSKKSYNRQLEHKRERAARRGDEDV